MTISILFPSCFHLTHQTLTVWFKLPISNKNIPRMPYLFLATKCHSWITLLLDVRCKNTVPWLCFKHPGKIHFQLLANTWYNYVFPLCKGNWKNPNEIIQKSNLLRKPNCVEIHPLHNTKRGDSAWICIKHTEVSRDGYFKIENILPIQVHKS